MESVEQPRNQSDIPIPLRLAVAFPQPIRLLALNMPTGPALVIGYREPTEDGFAEIFMCAPAAHSAGDAFHTLRNFRSLFWLSNIAFNKAFRQFVLPADVEFGIQRIESLDHSSIR